MANGFKLYHTTQYYIVRTVLCGAFSASKTVSELVPWPGLSFHLYFTCTLHAKELTGAPLKILHPALHPRDEKGV